MSGTVLDSEMVETDPTHLETLTVEVLPNTGSTCLTTVRPDKLQHGNLGQRKVYYKGHAKRVGGPSKDPVVF